MDDDGEDDEKDQIADEIFTRDGDGDGEEGGEGGETLHPEDDVEEEEGEESGRVSSCPQCGVFKTKYHYGVYVCCLFIFADIDDFIVDDDGQPITKKKGKKFTGYTDA